MMVLECPDCGCGISHKRNEWTGDKTRPDNKRKTKTYYVCANCGKHFNITDWEAERKAKG